VLELLKKIGLTSEAELRARLGIDNKNQVSSEGDKTGTVEDALRQLGISIQSLPPLPGPVGGDSKHAGGSGSSSSDERDTKRTGSGGDGGRSVASGGVRPFISYVAVHPEEEEPDPDGLNQQQRMTLEARAIEFILSKEPDWQRTPTHNPGFDLFKIDADGKLIQWCEVKAMAKSLEDRPVGLSRTQFECAREHRDNYWLYVVEYASSEDARIVRIQDPAGKARTFTFDRGWVSIAQVDRRKDGIGE